MTTPVSKVAAFVTLFAVSPLTPSSALSTVSSRKLGSSAYHHAVVKIGGCCTQWSILLLFKQKSFISWLEVLIPFQYVQHTWQVVSFSNFHAISS